MKWLIASLLALVMVSAAFAGEDPYISIVGNDVDGNAFYFSPKEQQFLYDQTLFSVPICFGANPAVTPQTRLGGLGCEQFRTNAPLNQPEICDTTGQVNGVGDFTFFGEPNAVIRKQNAGYFEWWIRLAKKPEGQLNIQLQCGVLKPNTFAFEGFGAVELCAAETGERIGTGFCTADQVPAGFNPLVSGALPKVTAIAYPGPFSLGFNAFHLTAFKVPSSFGNAPFGFIDAMRDPEVFQVLDGSRDTRVLLKACMTENIVAKIPVTEQYNALGEQEADLEAGDLIKVRMDIPISNTVDIYCNSQSARIAGIGESPF